MMTAIELPTRDDGAREFLYKLETKLFSLGKLARAINVMAGAEELADGYMAAGLYGISELMIETINELEDERGEVWRRVR